MHLLEGLHDRGVNKSGLNDRELNKLGNWGEKAGQQKLVYIFSKNYLFIIFWNNWRRCVTSDCLPKWKAGPSYARAQIHDPHFFEIMIIMG